MIVTRFIWLNIFHYKFIKFAERKKKNSRSAFIKLTIIIIIIYCIFYSVFEVNIPQFSANDM